MRINHLLFLLILFFSLQTQAQNDPISGDRPGMTTTGITLPRNHLQIETGFMFEDDFDYYSMPLFSTMLRYGLFNRFEVRLAFEPIFIAHTDTLKTKEFGLNYFKAGFKWKLLDEKGIIPSIFVLSNISLPYIKTLNDTTYAPSPDIRLAFAHTITDNIGLGYNFAASWDAEFHTSLLYTLAGFLKVNDNVDFFMEFYGNITDKMTAFDCGFAWRPKNDWQLDISAGKGISAYSYDFFVAAGLSYRLAKRKSS